MRLLIDECLPVNLKKHFVGHDCRTLKEMGWLGKKNGELLSLAEKQFDFLVTSIRAYRNSKDSPELV